VQNVESFVGLVASVKDQPCNRTMTVAVGHRTWCERSGWCVQEEPAGFRSARPFFAALQTWQHLPAAARRPLVAWHVRVGDQVLGSAAAFLRLAAEFSAEFSHVVFSSAPLCKGPHAKLFCELEQKMPKERTLFSTDQSTEGVLAQLITADVLVTSGSSFGNVQLVLLCCFSSVLF
jgi:hypothetical protein